MLIPSPLRSDARGENLKKLNFQNNSNSDEREF